MTVDEIPDDELDADDRAEVLGDVVRGRVGDGPRLVARLLVGEGGWVRQCVLVGLAGSESVFAHVGFP